MPAASSNPPLILRDLETLADLRDAIAVEREVWGASELDTIPLTIAIATKEAGNLWIGAFDGHILAGYAFGFFGMEHGRLILHSHQLAVREVYRNSDIGYRLKLAQRDRALALGLQQITWTFDPLQSKNAHLNFAKLGVVSNRYQSDFYGPETSSMLHRNGTDRLWVRWPIASRRVQNRVQGKDNRGEMLDALSVLQPLVKFNGEGRPVRADLDVALSRQRIAIEVPSDIAAIERDDLALAREWRECTRWAFGEALQSGFFVAEFCRTVRGQQGPGVYLLEKGTIEEYVPELARTVK